MALQGRLPVRSTAVSLLAFATCAWLALQADPSVVVQADLRVPQATTAQLFWRGAGEQFSEARSQRVAMFLTQQGYAQVANIAGGIDAWAEERDPGLPRY